MASRTIKESCPCGAILEYTEAIEEGDYGGSLANRQYSFHVQHAPCRVAAACEICNPPKET